MAQVTAVIPTYNQKELLVSALRVLKRQTLRPENVIVVDDGSTDDSAAAAAESGAVVLSNVSNKGFAAAVNLGVSRAETEYVAVLNNDVELAPDWLETLVAELESSGRWFATGKTLRREDPEVLDGTCDAMSKAGCAWRCGEGRQDGPLWSVPFDIRMASFTAIVFRKRLFERIGPLDERFESYLEDVDFGVRCAIAGLGGRYVPAAAAWHQGSATLGAWGPRKVRLISRNQVLLVAKHFPPSWFWRLGWHVFVGQTLWGLVAARHGAWFSWCRGKWDGWRLYRSIRRTAAPDRGFTGVLEEGEELIRRLQKQTGADPYWRLYFALT